jgi:hypothetical protein
VVSVRKLDKLRGILQPTDVTLEQMRVERWSKDTEARKDDIARMRESLRVRMLRVKVEVSTAELARWLVSHGKVAGRDSAGDRCRDKH